MAMDDKRRHHRKSLRGEALIADVLGNTWSKIDLLDISSTGLAFLSVEEFSSGAARMLRFYLPENTRRISAACKIIHCASHSYLQGYRVGVEFVRIDAQDLQDIEHFVE